MRLNFDDFDLEDIQEEQPRRDLPCDIRLQTDEEMEATGRSWLTDHATLRMAQRGIDQAAIDYVCHYGRTFDRAGSSIIFLALKDIPMPDRQKTWCCHLEGTTVILSKDSRVLTVYRNKSACKSIRRKPKEDRKKWSRLE